MEVSVELTFSPLQDEYETEIKKADADFDKILLMRQRKNLILNTIIKQLREKN